MLQIARSWRLAMAVLSLAPAVAAAEPLRVHAATYPLAFFAERIAGDAVEVTFSAPAGRDPAFWTPSIAEISEIQRSDVILLNGAGYARWTTKTSLPRRALLDTSAAFADQFIETETITHTHGPDGAHSHAGLAEIVWIDFTLAAAQAEATADRFTRLRPNDAARFTAGLEALQSELSALDESLKAIGVALGDRPLLASHPRYEYAARRYGWNLRSVDWDDESAPSPEQWAALEALIVDHPADVMIWNAEPPAVVVDALKKRGIDSIVFATAANRPENGDFLSVMRGNVNALQALVKR